MSEPVEPTDQERVDLEAARRASSPIASEPTVGAELRRRAVRALVLWGVLIAFFALVWLFVGPK